MDFCGSMAAWKILVLWAGQRFSEALAVSPSGIVVGRSSIPGETGQPAVMWTRDGITDLGTVGGLRFSRATDINARGDIVGTASPFEGFSGRAVVWLNGAVHDLNALIDPASGWVLTSAEGINARGQIVGFGTLNGQTRAFLATPDAFGGWSD
jgi:probable HAF family extracellular repeat protein